MKKAVIYYFSGSGNTKFIAETTVNKLQHQGYESDLINIEEASSKYSHENADLIGFIFPIYGFGLPEIGLKFLARLPKSQKQKAFLFVTPAGHEGIAIFDGALLIKYKGYDLIKSHPVYMNDTWILVMNAPERGKLKQTCEKNEAILEKYIDELCQNKKSISIANPIMIIILGIVNCAFHFLGRHQSGKAFTSTKKCNSCKLCVNSCPSKTIKWLPSDKPYWSWNCHQCFRCINNCPQNAIEISGFGMVAILIAMIFGILPYYLIPANITYYLNYLVPFPEIAVGILSGCTLLWLIQKLLTFNILPAWYLTKSRRRYKFDEILKSPE